MTSRVPCGAVGTTDGELNEVREPLQIPPTRAPRRRRRPWSTGKRTFAAIVVVLAVGLSASLFVDREVTKRLATIEMVTTTTSVPTTTTIVPRPFTPRRTRSQPAPVAAPTPAATTTTTAPVEVKSEVAESGYDIIQKLDALPVREERSLGYSRYRFGLWSDEDNDYCSTREDILIRDAIRPVVKTATCSIEAGTWKSPYDDVTVNDPDGITVDHLVGLYEAWKSGAWDWTDAQRNEYLNDDEHVEAVRAVSSASRRDKDGRDPSDWLPPNESFRCQYLQTWVDMKTVWKLAVDAGERESIAAAALSC